MHPVLHVRLLAIMWLLSSSGFCKSLDKILSRNKRYLTFPEGSTLSVAICLTFQTGITPGQIYTEAMNWGINYNLPNDTKEFTKDTFLGLPKDLIQRRHRRDLYTKMEKIMNSMGYNGRDCILRALCEASRNFKPEGDSLIDEILRIVFGYPQKRDVILETGSHHQYESASRIGVETKNDEMECYNVFPGCPFSLIDLALGHYTNDYLPL